MNAREAIRLNLDQGDSITRMYLADLSDTELLVRPVPACNHITWQLGHLISSEVDLLNSVCPGQGAELPAGFKEKHSKEQIGCEDASQFFTKQEYQDLLAKVHASTAAALDGLSDADLDQPSPEWLRKHFPTVGQMFTLIGSHPMMHAGQFVVVRRALGKPVLI